MYCVPSTWTRLAPIVALLVITNASDSLAQSDAGTARTYVATFEGFRAPTSLAPARARAFVLAHSREIGACYANHIEVPAAAAGDNVTVQFTVGAHGELGGFYLSGGVSFGDCVTALARHWTFPRPYPTGEITFRIAVRPAS